MMRRMLNVGLASLLLATVGLAQGAGEIKHVSGGIGIAEQQRITAQEDEYNLKLVFTLVEGNYVADVRVVVKDGKGATVVEDTADGPFFLARLPAGQYTVVATFEDRSVTRKVSIGKRGLRTEYLRWPSNPKTDLAVSRWIER